MERDVIRYDRGIQITLCKVTSEDLTIKLDCRSRVSYRLQNNGTYANKNVFAIDSFANTLYARYYF